MFANVLIANRGEIACRIVATARRLGMRSIAIHTPADRGALFTRLADEVHEIGEGGVGYLDGAGIVALAKSVRRPVPASGLRVPVGKRRFRRSLRPGRDRLRRTAARGDAGDGAQELRQGADAARRRAGRARLSRRQPERRSSCARRPTRSVIRCWSRRSPAAAGAGMRRVDAHMDFEAALESASREARGGVRRRRGC